ncbi:MAG: hypothetical protein BGO89_04100 [Candidatus Kapaibacterium thiocyanatum]|uniref:Uncharacterized protein n=1 Tax=Candidatus Kapaibacterium thiocyanatum TaxID=1895771 RepID=A0A1M3L5E0_9BACT|nr:MAG: hypothetical protein BGO89_04100 ['Candidatus Kapabacteria' thiocyanatum]
MPLDQHKSLGSGSLLHHERPEKAITFEDEACDPDVLDRLRNAWEPHIPLRVVRGVTVAGLDLLAFQKYRQAPLTFPFPEVVEDVVVGGGVVINEERKVRSVLRFPATLDLEVLP